MLTAHTCRHSRSVAIRRLRNGLFAALTLGVGVVACANEATADTKTSEVKSSFDKDIQPLLQQYCYDCHGDGAHKGQVTLDEFKNADALRNHDLWLRVLKNVRAGLMPPSKKPQPSAEERTALEKWIKYEAFGLDPNDPDPGRVTLHRLNRTEYRNTIRDLMGVEYKTEEEFPSDDSGYGFDNIGDVLTVSPLLLEKYMQAAEVIVAKAVPTVGRVVPERVVPGNKFKETNGNEVVQDDSGSPGAKLAAGESGALSYYDEAKVASAVDVETAGDYKLVVDLAVRGQFSFDPGRCKVKFKVDDKELLDDKELFNKDFEWANSKRLTFEFSQALEKGEHKLAFEIQPLVEKDKRQNSLDLRIVSVKVQGPNDPQHWKRTPNYDRFFPRPEPPQSDGERKEYAREIVKRFATKAFRRPVDERTVDRLVAIAEEGYRLPGHRFEEGIRGAIVAVLASPRFIFRIEDARPGNDAKAFAPIDEYALASRLSYFLWSTMPDEELLSLAEKGELRQNLPAQVKRMLSDPRSRELVQNFTGQWLQARDMDGISIDARSVFARDNGSDRDLQRQQEERRAAFERIAKLPEEERQKELAKLRQGGQGQRRFGRFAPPPVELDGELRRAMRRETEMSFEYVMREDRSLLDLIDCDYTFVNEKLAKVYNIPDVKGREMRRVTLPPDSPRGGLLTQGTVLVVTSNPTRTSPVKRGLFVLDNILGMPPPPPPPDIPNLEESETGVKDHDPTLREILEIHRGKPLCASCHNRMDPLGLALENFNALGMWRDSERKQPIDATGKLITGEPFKDIRELKKILRDKHANDFYRCLAEKLLTYALGRGLEYYDVEAVDRIVERVQKEDGKFSALLNGIVESAPFQKRRTASPAPAAQEANAEAKPAEGS